MKESKSVKKYDSIHIYFTLTKHYYEQNTTESESVVKSQWNSYIPYEYQLLIKKIHELIKETG